MIGSRGGRHNPVDAIKFHRMVNEQYLPMRRAAQAMQVIIDWHIQANDTCHTVYIDFER